MEIINELKELNLDDNEIKIYLSCLSLGSSKVHDISIKAKLIRTTCYGVLKSLIEKGLISTVIKDNITHYQATSPKQLIEILDEKKKKINSILPQLEKIQKYTTPTKHNVHVFEGKEGMKTIFNDLTSKPDEIVKIIGFFGKWIEFFDFYSDMYYRKKKEKNIETFALVDEKEKNISKNKKIKNTTIKYLKDLDIDSECFIYQDKVAFVSFEKDNLKGVIIQNKEMFRLQSDLFDRLWKIAKD